MRKVLGARLNREGITLRQWEVLAWLSSDGCGSQTELAESLGIEPHTLAGILTRMERDGLLERKSCEQDRRKNKIHPTAKAEEVWARVTQICQEIRSQATKGFTEEDKASLQRLCARMRENLALADVAGGDEPSSICGLDAETESLSAADR
jgi:MarR family transcriptional regulator for hemolysin